MQTPESGDASTEGEFYANQRHSTLVPADALESATVLVDSSGLMLATLGATGRR